MLPYVRKQLNLYCSFRAETPRPSKIGSSASTCFCTDWHNKANPSAPLTGEDWSREAAQIFSFYSFTAKKIFFTQGNCAVFADSVQNSQKNVLSLTKKEKKKKKKISLHEQFYFCSGYSLVCSEQSSTLLFTNFELIVMRDRSLACN